MWDKLEKLEILLYQQQNVIAQLLSALITTGEGGNQISDATNQIDFLFEDIGQVTSKHESNKPSPVFETPAIENVPVSPSKSPEFNIITKTPSVESIHETPKIEKVVDEEKTEEKIDSTVFTSSDYVHFHEETKPVITENDIESLIEIEKFLNFKKKYSIPRSQQKQQSTEDESRKPGSRRASRSSQTKQLAELIQKCENISNSTEDDSKPELKAEAFTHRHSVPRDEGRRRSAYSLLEPSAVPKLSTPAPIRRVSADFRPALVKENPIDEQIDIFDITKPEDVTVEPSTEPDVLIQPGVPEEPEVSVHLEEEPKIELNQTIQENVSPIVVSSAPSTCVPSITSTQSIEQVQPPRSPQPIPKDPIKQHRRFNSLEESNIISSITNSARQGFQNVFNRSSFFKGPSTGSATTIPTMSSTTVTNTNAPSNIKSSLKSIFGGFKSLQDSRELPLQDQHQPMSSMPELTKTDSEERRIRFEERVDHVEPKTYDEPTKEYVHQTSLPHTEGSSEKTEKVPYVRTQSMMEANTMMDTLKVTPNHDNSHKNKLEKSFSDESAIFSFTPSSRQSSIVQSEGEPANYDSNSTLCVKEDVLESNRTTEQPSSGQFELMTPKEDEQLFLTNKGLFSQPGLKWYIMISI